MFSLIITIVSIALVAALALATLYYGGRAFTQSTADAQASKIVNQGQQLLGAAELYYAEYGQWPERLSDLLDSGYLKTVPVAQAAVTQALADNSWTMPVAREPLFLLQTPEAEPCRGVNKKSYGQPGILPVIKTNLVMQCYGKDLNQLVTIAARNPKNLEIPANAIAAGLDPADVDNGPLPDPSGTEGWLVSPGADAQPVSPGTGNGGGNPTEPEPSPALLALEPDSVTFGSVANHTTSTQVLQLVNRGGSPLALDSMAQLTGGPAFAQLSTTCGTSLLPGASCDITLSFSPTNLGEDTAQLTLRTGSPLVDTVVQVTGSAFNPVSLGSATLPNAQVSKAYAGFDFKSVLAVSNEASPDMGAVTWSTTGSVPTGLSLSSAGVLGGTPTQATSAGGASFQVLATYKDNTGQQVYTIRVADVFLEVKSISAGAAHACAVTTAGAAKCWGANSSGQLGNSTTTNSNRPVTVTGLSGGVATISAGYSHSCAVDVVGNTFCWGSNTYGQLGDGGTSSRAHPGPVTGFGSGQGSQVAAGGYHSCGIKTSGAMFCWGRNNEGQLGNGGLSTAVTPAQVTGLTSGVTAMGLRPSSEFAGTCAVHNGAAKCWGWNDGNSLGDGSQINGIKADPLPVVGLTSGVTAIQMGRAHTCAIQSGGIKCWGDNSFGQHGVGATPGNTPRSPNGMTSNVSALAVGMDHVCAVQSGALKCWGRNGNGQLGDNSTTSRNTPTDVAGLTSGVTRVIAGNDFSCAGTSEGMKCWGNNSSGQIGDATNTQRLTPAGVLP